MSFIKKLLSIFFGSTSNETKENIPGQAVKSEPSETAAVQASPPAVEAKGEGLCQVCGIPVSPVYKSCTKCVSAKAAVPVRTVEVKGKASCTACGNPVLPVYRLCTDCAVVR